MTKVIGSVERGYGTFPLLDYEGDNFCLRCGRCCWDWKNDNPEDKCAHLAADMNTCLIYGKLEEYSRGECAQPMQIHQVVDLHPDCGYVLLWDEMGLI